MYFENDDEEVPPAVRKSERSPSPPLEFIKAATLPGSEPLNVGVSTNPNEIDFNPTSAGSDEEDSFIHAKIVKKKQPVIGIVTKKRKK